MAPCACGHCAAGAADLFGLLHDPQRPASTVAQMNEAVGRHLAEDGGRSRRRSNTSATKRKGRR